MKINAETHAALQRWRGCDTLTHGALCGSGPSSAVLSCLRRSRLKACSRAAASVQAPESEERAWADLSPGHHPDWSLG